MFKNRYKSVLKEVVPLKELTAGFRGYKGVTVQHNKKHGSWFIPTAAELNGNCMAVH